MGKKIAVWLKENKERLLVLCGVLLVGVLCFQAGLIQGKLKQEKPLVISVPASPAAASSAEPSQPSLSPTLEPVAAVVGKKNCLFVGSKNSNKYHLPTCAAAKRIKPENLVCFSSKEEAEKRGYVPSCLK